jgi:hypothetical protein
MVKLGVAVLIMALVLGVAAVGALRGEPVDASGLVSTPDVAAPSAAQIPQEPAPPIAPQQVVPEDSDSKPFIGVTIHGISSDAAERLGIASGVRVVHVFENGPADGVLLGNDVIVAVDGSDVTVVRDLMDAIQATSVGDTVSITVVRGDETLELSVEVADRSDMDIAHRSATRLQFRTGSGGIGAAALPLSGLFGGALDQLRVLEQNFVRAEVVLETDDGFKTIAAVKGTISELDVAAGTFTLDPKDGSDPIDYQINDDTVVGMVHDGDLGGLNTEDETLVVTVDGEVKLVQQGSLLDTKQVNGLTTLLPHLRAGGPGGIGTRLPDIRLRLGDALGKLDHLKDRDGERFLSESLLERIREAMKEAEEGIADE